MVTVACRSFCLVFGLWGCTTVLVFAVVGFLEDFICCLVFAPLLVFAVGVASLANVFILEICVMDALGRMSYQCDIEMLICFTGAAKGIICYINGSLVRLTRGISMLMTHLPPWHLPSPSKLKLHHPYTLAA